MFSHMQFYYLILQELVKEGMIASGHNFCMRGNLDPEKLPLKYVHKANFTEIYIIVLLAITH